MVNDKRELENYKKINPRFLMAQIPIRKLERFCAWPQGQFRAISFWNLNVEMLFFLIYKLNISTTDVLISFFCALRIVLFFNELLTGNSYREVLKSSFTCTRTGRCILCIINRIIMEFPRFFLGSWSKFLFHEKNQNLFVNIMQCDINKPWTLCT